MRIAKVRLRDPKRVHQGLEATLFSVLSMGNKEAEELILTLNRLLDKVIFP